MQLILYPSSYETIIDLIPLDFNFPIKPSLHKLSADEPCLLSSLSKICLRSGLCNINIWDISAAYDSPIIARLTSLDCSIFKSSMKKLAWYDLNS